MKKVALIIGLILILLFTACSSETKGEDNSAELAGQIESLEKEKEALTDRIAELEKSNNDSSEYEKKYNDLKKEYDELSKDYSDLSKEYDEYKSLMEPYEGLSEAEAEARRIEAEAVAESEAAKKAEEEAAAKAESEAKEKAGYDTGITYDQLARTPDDYKGEKVKFYGEVIQVMEGDDYVQIRFAVNSDYDKVLYCEYDKDIVSSRILEYDKITIYGTSYGLFSYESTLGGTITIPAVIVEKIDQ